MRPTIDYPKWSPGKDLDTLVKEVILRALKFYKGNRTHTADNLGISIRTLQKKLNEYGVSIDERNNLA